MNKAFMEAAVSLNNDFVREWKEAGKKVVGYTCSYVPDEIFHAAGILPYRIRGFGATETTIGDTYFGPFICSLPKACCSWPARGSSIFWTAPSSRRAAIRCGGSTNAGARRARTLQGILPNFFFHFGVPHKYADYTIKWFTEESRRLMTAVEKHFGVSITDEKLREAIQLYNKSRDLLERFDALRTADTPSITGTDALAVILAGTTMPRGSTCRTAGRSDQRLAEERGKISRAGYG